MVNNYKPISLLNIVSKILDRLVFDKMYLIVDFTKSTISNYDIIGNDLDKGAQNDIIFLDFFKAFDKVLYYMISYCIRTFGFNDKLLAL